METYPLSLALEDLLPVIFFGIGLILLARMIGEMHSPARGRATLGAILITLGGLTKVVWKIVIAATGTDINGLDDLLFVFLAPGFILLAWATGEAQRAGKGQSIQRTWIFPAVLLGLGILGAGYTGFTQTGRTWVYILLATTTIANVWASALFIRHARQEGLKLAAGLFFVNILLVFVLSGMGRIPSQTVALQWVEQIINTFSTGAFAFAAWKLSGHVRGGEGGEVPLRLK